MWQQTPQCAGVEPSPARGQEQRDLCAARKLWACLVEVARQPVRRLLAKRYRSFLAALAVNVEKLLLEVDVAEVEIHRLAAAQAGRVDQLRDGAVPEPERAFRLEPREYGVDFGRLGRVGQAPRPRW